MNTIDKETAEYNKWKLIHNFMHPDELIKEWINESNYTDHYKESWDQLMPVVKKLDSWANENMSFEHFDDYRTSQWKMINNPSKYSITDVHNQVVEFIKKYEPTTEIERRTFVIESKVTRTEVTEVTATSKENAIKYAEDNPHLTWEQVQDEKRTLISIS